MYQKAKEYTEKNNLVNEVGSSMIWGSQYDQMMIWMQKNKIDVTLSEPNGATCNRSDKTGSVEGDQLNKVYDLLGHYWEWTMENCTTYYRPRRRRKCPRKLFSECPS